MWIFKALRKKEENAGNQHFLLFFVVSIQTSKKKVFELHLFCVTIIC